MKTGVELIAKERKRQIEKEGWTSKHDDKHTNEEMARAAMCYANPIPSEGFITAYWPWEREWYKPSKYNDNTLQPQKIDRIKELVKAGALIAAEIDRLQRVQNQTLKTKYEDLKCEFCNGNGEREIYHETMGDCPIVCDFCNGTGIDQNQLEKIFYNEFSITQETQCMNCGCSFGVHRDDKTCPEFFNGEFRGWLETKFQFIK